ncbi:MAG: hypothetical protein BWX88_04644 [Planctomycetes bacterium ADurb.Bin126]|nr:MAG: hypothetical protein BWX88_04644 [Planctomycetes bacterium ADurb.Bin126]
MATSMARFVANDDLWNAVQTHVERAKHVSAAIAYLGQNGTKLLPLKRGDRLVVDMSFSAVTQGVTDPREVRKFVRRGVKVFTRTSLHAKFLVLDKTVIVGSANASMNSRRGLDEAGIITTDPAAVRKAMNFFENLCTEPVRERYLKECVKAYRPPKFKPAVVAGRRTKRQPRIAQAKLWFIGGVQQVELSEQEAKSMARVERRAEKKLKNPDKTSVAWVRFGRRPKYLDSIRTGDWVVVCSTDGGPRFVEAPAQALGQDLWTSPTGTKYEMLLLESLDAGQDMKLTEFRRRVRTLEPYLDRKSPRTRPIADDAHADAILRLWTVAGHIRGVRKHTDR